MSTVSGRLILEQLTFGNENREVYVSSFKVTKLGFKTENGLFGLQRKSKTDISWLSDWSN